MSPSISTYPWFLVLVALLLTACSGGLMKPGDPVDIISGTYEMEGIQVNEVYCLIGCVPERYGEVMRSDTFQVSFTVDVSFAPNREDTLLFSGLHGADQTIKHLDSNRKTTNPRCGPGSHVSDCTYARLIDQELIFELITPFGAYTGGGTISLGRITLETNYFYRGLSVDYYLTGRKKF